MWPCVFYNWQGWVTRYWVGVFIFVGEFYIYGAAPLVLWN